MATKSKKENTLANFQIICYTSFVVIFPRCRGAEERDNKMSNLEIKTPLLRQADQYTIGQYEQAALADFAMHLMNLYSELKDKKSDMYSVGFYKTFEYEVCQKALYINPKNINYASTITDTRNQLSQFALPFKVDCGVPNEILKEGYNYFQDIPNWEDLFGKGEFPQLVIRVFRLGNTEYFCYSITR